MKVPFVDLTAQLNSIRPEIDLAIRQVMDECAYIGFRDNPFVQRFEGAFASWLGLPHCVGCANGTDSLELVLKALGVGPGDEVLVPANSWISTSEAVSTVGARPVFVDVLPGRFTIDPDQLVRWASPRTRAIIPVHLYGLPAEMDKIMAFAQARGLHVIEDCAQAHGAEFRGKKVGTFGVAGSFSFYPGKNLGAYGDAGAVVTADASLADKVRMLANHGRFGKFDHLVEGRNSRLDGLQAAVLATKLPRLDAWTESRIGRARRYFSLLEGAGATLPELVSDSRHVFHLFVVRVRNRERVRELLREAGVETGVHYPRALPELKAYEPHGLDLSDYPVAVSSAAEILSLPMFAELSEPQLAHVARSLREAIHAAR